MKFNSILLILFSALYGMAQENSIVKLRTIAFYNVENLFDTENDSLTYDDDRTPTGKDHWTDDRYIHKINNISKVLSEIGAHKINSSPDIIGLCEIENSKVLQDLIAHPNLEGSKYGFIHFDSPDERGIDVGLLFKKAVFLPTSFVSRRLLLQNDEGERDYTRDQLVVGGILDDVQIYFIINHWPSRSGGEASSKPNRIAAALLNKSIIDSILKIDERAKIISMGDYNDDPIDESFKKILKTRGSKKGIEPNELYNPMEKLFKKGIGSLAYRDNWNLFDQFFITSSLLENNWDSYRLWKADVFRPSYLIVSNGKYKGYPFRTYSGGNYTGGYSDHFPVYMYLIKKLQ